MTELAHSTRYPIDERADRILAAGLTEFTRRGIRGARMSAVAREAGISVATLRQYFPSRDDLFREVVRSSIVRSVRHQPKPDPPATAGPLTDRVREFVRQFWRTMDEPDRAALLRLSLGELHEFPELAVFHSTEVIGRAVSRLESMLGEAAKRGEIKCTDVRTAARVIQAVVLTYALWFASPAIYGDLTGPDRRRAEEAVIDVLVWALGGSGR